MTVNVLMPALSPTMEQGKLAKWLKSEGDEVKAGDVIAEIETDKATMEVEAVDEGVLARILVPGGTENVAVNTPIAVIAGEGEDASAVAAPPEAKPPTPPSAPQDEAGEANEARIEAAKEAAAPAPKPVSVAAPPTVSAAPEVPAGTTMIPMTMREALRDAMAEEMRRDPNVFIMGEEVGEYQGAYKVTQGLLQEFGPMRVRDTPITEYGFTGIGVGAAFAGLRPIVEFMTFNFSMQAIDHVVNSAAKTLYMSGGQINSAIVFRGPNGAAARVGAQHSQDYSAWYAQVPGLIVIAPSNASDAKGLLKAAIRDNNPVVFLENEILYGKTSEVPALEDFVLPIGKARIARPGTDVTLVSFSIGMTYALAAADELAKEGIEAEVIDLRTLRPMDSATIIESVKKTGRCVAIEEGWSQCGISAEIATRVQQEAFDYLDAPVLRVTGKDVPMPYAANLEKLALPSVADVVAAAKAVLYRD
jgi:pyruvate dehydrogenase E1 component beta subunit